MHHTHLFTTPLLFRRRQVTLYSAVAKKLLPHVEVVRGSTSTHHNRYGAATTFQTRPYDSMATLQMSTTMDKHTAARRADGFPRLSTLAVVECTSSNSRATSLPYTTRHLQHACLADFPRLHGTRRDQATSPANKRMTNTAHDEP